MPQLTGCGESKSRLLYPLPSPSISMIGGRVLLWQRSKPALETVSKIPLALSSEILIANSPLILLADGQCFFNPAMSLSLVQGHSLQRSLVFVSI